MHNEVISTNNQQTKFVLSLIVRRELGTTFLTEALRELAHNWCHSMTEQVMSTIVIVDMPYEG